MLWQEAAQFLPKPTLSFRGEEIQSASLWGIIWNKSHLHQSLLCYHSRPPFCYTSLTGVLPKHSSHKQHTSCTAALAVLFWRPSAPVCLYSVLRSTIILSLFSFFCPIFFLVCFQNLTNRPSGISFQLNAFQQKLPIPCLRVRNVEKKKEN